MTYKGYLVWFLNRNYENVMFEGKKDHDLPFVVYRPFVVYLPVYYIGQPAISSNMTTLS